MDVALQFARPLEEAPEVPPLPPHKFPEFQKADLRHLHAGVGLDAPQKVGTPPWSQTMPLGGIPEEAERVAHEPS